METDPTAATDRAKWRLTLQQQQQQQQQTDRARWRLTLQQQQQQQQSQMETDPTAAAAAISESDGD